MNKLLTDGYKEIEDFLGYWPSFHDDMIDKIEITDEKITVYISIQSPPHGIKLCPRIKLIFAGIQKFILEGELYKCVSIILDIESEKLENNIETQISTSLGTSGTIWSSEVKIEFEKDNIK